MATTVLNGKDYILEIDEVTTITAPRGSNASYKPILCEVSSTFGITTDEQSVSNKCGGGWSNSNPGDSSFTFSGEFQAIDPTTADASAISLANIANLAVTKKKFWLRRTKSGDAAAGVPTIVREGVVYISNYSEETGTEDPFSFTADFTGVGTPLITPSTT